MFDFKQGHLTLESLFHYGEIKPCSVEKNCDHFQPPLIHRLHRQSNYKLLKNPTYFPPIRPNLTTDQRPVTLTDNHLLIKA